MPQTLLGISQNITPIGSLIKANDSNAQRALTQSCPGSNSQIPSLHRMEYQGSRLCGIINCQRRLSQRSPGALFATTPELLFSLVFFLSARCGDQESLVQTATLTIKQHEVISHHSPIHQHKTEKPFEPSF